MASKSSDRSYQFLIIYLSTQNRMTRQIYYNVPVLLLVLKSFFFKSPSEIVNEKEINTVMKIMKGRKITKKKIGSMTNIKNNRKTNIDSFQRVQPQLTKNTNVISPPRIFCVLSQTVVLNFWGCLSFNDSIIFFFSSPLISVMFSSPPLKYFISFTSSTSSSP